MSPFSQLRLFAVIVVLSGFAAACGKGETTYACQADEECSAGLACIAGACRAPVVGQGDEAPGDGDAGGGGGGGGDGDSGGDDHGDGDGDETPFPDVQGPSITIVSPSEYEIVGKRFDVVASISDDSAGVDGTSLWVIIGSQLDASTRIELELRQIGNETYGTEVDATLLPYMAFPYIAVLASDNEGNKNEVGHAFTLDLEPPRIGLTSPDVRIMRINKDGINECSSFIHPLGRPTYPWTLMHGRTYSPASTDALVFYPRARIVDRGNVTGGPMGLRSGVNDATTEIYFLDRSGANATRPLLLGGGSGTMCTGINPAVKPQPDEPDADAALVQSLVPVKTAGSPDFFGGSSGSDCTDDCMCQTATESTAGPPDLVCAGVDLSLTFWLYDNPHNRGPGVYVLNAYNASDVFLCSGGPFDIRNFLRDGPYCVAAVAEDLAGNASASAPIAICIDRDGDGDCATFDEAAADAVVAGCTDGCTGTSFGIVTDPTEIHFDEEM